jgi:hypothetical protein
MPAKGFLAALLGQEQDEPTIIERLRGKRMRDIELPAEGPMDQKLKRHQPEYAAEKFKLGVDILRNRSKR